MTLEELNLQLESDKQNVYARKIVFNEAKASLRKARLTSISNKLLVPYRIFQSNLAVVKYDAMIRKLEREREKEVRRVERLEARDKIKEDIDNILLDVKSMAVSNVSKIFSLSLNVKNSAIEKFKASTTVDLTIRNILEDLKLSYVTGKYNKTMEKKAKEEEKEKHRKFDDAINFDEGVKIEFKKRDVPFSNIDEKIQKASRQWSYMGKATNRAVRYFKSKKDKLVSNVQEKALDTELKMIVNAYDTFGKVSVAKSKIMTTFNNKISDYKDKVNSMIGDVVVATDDKINSINTSLNRVRGSVVQSFEDRKVRNERKKDMIAALREQDERDISIKRAQLDSMREAIEAVNKNSDMLGSAPSLDVARTMK